MTGAERQRKFKQSMSEKGMVQVSVWVHESQAADLKIAANIMASDPDLTPATLRNVATGRYTKAR